MKEVGMRAVWLVLVLVGCDSSDGPSTTTMGDAGAQADAEEPLLGTPCSVENVAGTLPGVTISIFSDSCVYKRGQAATFTYRVVTSSAVPAIDVPASNSCDCNHRTTQIESWVGWTISGTSTSGQQQQYCYCDTGCCAPQSMATITPDVGIYEDEITWSGHTWQGPSDTGNPEGEAFLIGDYAVQVGFAGYAQGSVSAALSIEIVP